MDDIRVLYTNEQNDFEKSYLHIYGIRIVNDYINVCVYSDRDMLEMYINGRLCSRQKGKEIFDFYEKCPECQSAEIKIADTREPKLCEVVKVAI